MKSLFAVLLALAAQVYAAPKEVLFGSLGGTVTFTGNSDSFAFSPNIFGPADSFATSGDGFASSFALFSGIEGLFEIGAIGSCGAGCQIASVNSTGGKLSIFDGNGGAFTADLSWVNIQSRDAVTTGKINTNATVNLSGFSYTPVGSPVNGLLELAAEPAGIVTASFQFNSGLTLSNLVADGSTFATSWSATLTTVPEPRFYGLLGLGLAGVVFVSHRLRKRASV